MIWPVVLLAATECGHVHGCSRQAIVPAVQLSMTLFAPDHALVGSIALTAAGSLTKSYSQIAIGLLSSGHLRCDHVCLARRQAQHHYMPKDVKKFVLAC